MALLNNDLQFAQLFPHGHKIAAVAISIMTIIKPRRRSKELYRLADPLKNTKVFKEIFCRFCFCLMATGRVAALGKRSWKSKSLAL